MVSLSCLLSCLQSPPQLFSALRDVTRKVVSLLHLQAPGQLTSRTSLGSRLASVDSPLASLSSPMSFPPWPTQSLKGLVGLTCFRGLEGWPKASACRAAPWWVACFDIIHDGAEDLLQPAVQAHILEILGSGRVKGCSGGPVCASFSSAITPAWRTAAHPEGVPWATFEQRLKLERGNKFLAFTYDVIEACIRHGLIYCFENPQNSRFWFQPGWPLVLEGNGPHDFLTDFCVWGLCGGRPLGFGQMASFAESDFGANANSLIWC